MLYLFDVVLPGDDQAIGRGTFSSHITVDRALACSVEAAATLERKGGGGGGGGWGMGVL